VVLRTSTDREGVAAVAVPVADQDAVTGAAVGERRVRLAAPRRVAHVEHVPATHRDGVGPVPVPVTDEDLVGEAAVVERVVRGAGPVVRQEEPVLLVRDRRGPGLTGGGGRVAPPGGRA